MLSNERMEFAEFICQILFQYRIFHFCHIRGYFRVFGVGGRPKLQVGGRFLGGRFGSGGAPKLPSGGARWGGAQFFNIFQRITKFFII